MTLWMELTLGGLGLIAVGLGLAIRFGSARWSKMTFQYIVSLLSFMPLADEQGKAELTAGALQRYLAEAVWFPTALLPGAGVRWSSIDNHRALATLTDSGTTVSLEFHFNDIGEITGVFTPGRYRHVNGKYELTPWKGHHRNYQERGGMRIPTEGEVEWHLPTGRFSVWRGKIVEVKYDFAR